MNFIEKYTIRDKKLCDELIKYHNDNKEYKREGVTLTGIDKNVKDSIDVIFHNTSKNESIQKYFNEISSFAQQYMHKYKIISNLNTEYGSDLLNSCLKIDANFANGDVKACIAVLSFILLASGNNLK